MAIQIRKWATFREEILSDGGRDLERPLRRVAVAAVVTEPVRGPLVRGPVRAHRPRASTSATS